MNKQKFEAKCQELYAYEDEMLAKMKEYVKPFNDDLNDHGLKVVARLMWYYPENESLTLTRQPICRKVAYMCSINVAICPIDEDLEDETAEGRGISLNDSVSAYGLTIWRGWSFIKRKGSFIYKNLESTCADIKKCGLDKVVKDRLSDQKKTVSL